MPGETLLKFDLVGEVYPGSACAVFHVILSGNHWLCVSPLQLGFCVHSSVFLNPHTAHFHYKIALNGFYMNC